MKRKLSQGRSRRDRILARHADRPVTIRHFNGGVVWDGTAGELLAACPPGRPWWAGPLANAAGTPGASSGDPVRVIQMTFRA